MMQVRAGNLDVAYRDLGPEDGRVALLLHGWPDDATTWDGVAPAIAAAGFRVIVPTLRGFGETRFLRDDTLRTGNSGILAIDAIALLDTLGVSRCAVVGHDWGSNIAEALAVGWPARIDRIALLATPPRLGGMPTPPFWHAQREWYHWFMATERGAQAVLDDPRGFTHLHWENWSPPGWFDETTFEAVAASFNNPDWVEVTLHSYRARWDEALPDPASQWLEAKVKQTRTLAVPALYFQGAVDGVNPPAAAKSVSEKFTGAFEFVLVEGVGHFIQREAPDRVLAKLLPFLADMSI
uniref:alpha/beta fold hydrolase n=1 Tax=uncultured Sphingomonas sp. TaxID=158754 RepID=UPI0035C95BDB